MKINNNKRNKQAIKFSEEAYQEVLRLIEKIKVEIIPAFAGFTKEQIDTLSEMTWEELREIEEAVKLKIMTGDSLNEDIDTERLEAELLNLRNTYRAIHEIKKLKEALSAALGNEEEQIRNYYATLYGGYTENNENEQPDIEEMIHKIKACHKQKKNSE